MCAGSTNLSETAKFGVLDERVFGVSTLGVLPLSLFYGFDNIQEFLNGMKSIDDHLRNTKDVT